MVFQLWLRKKQASRVAQPVGFGAENFGYVEKLLRLLCDCYAMWLLDDKIELFYCASDKNHNCSCKSVREKFRGRIVLLLILLTCET